MKAGFRYWIMIAVLLGATTGMGYGTLPGSNNSGCLVEGGSCSAVTKSITQKIDEDKGNVKGAIEEMKHAVKEAVKK